MTETFHTGGCLCGAVMFSVAGKLDQPIACHCVQCRKASGHYTVAARARRDEVTITGEVGWYEYKPGVAQGFCPSCGSNLFWRSGPEYLSVEMGALTETSGLSISCHIFVAEKGTYYEISDGLPEYPGDNGDEAQL